LFKERPVITFACPTCQKTYSVTDDKAGMRTKCRQCREPLVVPVAPPPSQWKADADIASAGTAERAKTPTDAEFVLPPVPKVDSSSTESDDAEAPAEAAKGQVFVVELEFDGDPGPMTEELNELYVEARRFLVDVLYAYRHRLAPKGIRLRKVRVDEFEREV